MDEFTEKKFVLVACVILLSFIMSYLKIFAEPTVVTMVLSSLAMLVTGDVTEKFLKK